MKKFVKVISIVLLAIPGVIIFSLSTIVLFGGHIDRYSHTEQLLILASFILSAISILVGTGKLRELCYIFVFISIPIAMTLYSFFPNSDIIGSIFFGFIAAMWTNAMVKLYYKKKREKEKEESDSIDLRGNENSCDH